MKLNLNTIKEREFYEKNGIKVPNFDVEELQKKTLNNCKWLHFGAGNIFRAYIGKIQQDLIEKNMESTGIIAVDTLSGEAINKTYKPYDNLCISVVLSKDGIDSKEVIGSISEAIDYSNDNEYNLLSEIIANDNLQIVSFTVTEKGYNLYDINGNYLKIIEEDIKNGPDKSSHLISKVTRLLYERFKYGEKPITLLSLDNCSRNGDLLKNAIITIATEWEKNKFVENDFIKYLIDEEKITFPITMIDKITPRPSIKVEKILKDDGIENMEIIKSDIGGFYAPFVNSEKAGYLVIEDKFANGRPRLEEVGVFLTTREDVTKSEIMKVTTCLNPLHTTLAIFGCLLNYNLIADEMEDKELVNLIKKVGYDESLKVVDSPKILDPKKFIDEVINERLPNKFLPDSPQRIAMDTSQKVGIRFGHTIKAYYDDKDRNISELKYIPLVLAGWLRYLLGVNDEGLEFELSSDPLLADLKTYFEGITLDNFNINTDKINELLSKETIFGVNLVKIGLSDLIIEYFKELSEGKGAIRRTLKNYL